MFTTAHRPLGLGARLAVAATLGTAVLAAAGQSGATASPSAPSPRAASNATSSSLAPVQLPGQKSATTYSAAQVDSFKRQGGDPRVTAYWTAERMKQAKSIDLPGDNEKVEAALAKAAKQLADKAGPGTIGTAPAAATNTGARAKAAAAAPVTNFSRTNGKLFIGGYGSTSWCSASSINTASRRVVITAGHCVHGGKGSTWKSNLVFVPGYNAYASDPTPVGMFQAYRLRTFNEWINNGSQYLTSSSLPGFQRDVGFVTTYNGGDWNTTVGATVGGHGIYYNGSYGYDVSIFGYPSNRASGNAMSACWGTTSADDWAYRSRIVGCGFAPGSSGGPWLWSYSNASGLGYVRGVMSTYSSSTNVNATAYFDTAVYNALQAANGDW